MKMSRSEYTANKKLVSSAKPVKTAPVGYITGPVIRDTRYSVETVGNPKDSSTWRLI